MLVEKNRKLGRNGTLIKMKTYNNIYEKIIDKYNIRLAHMNARKDKTFYKEVQMVDSDMDFYITEIHNMLKDWTYKIEESDYRTSKINDKWKERELWKLAYYPHRIVQWAIMIQLEPIFLEVFCNHTCASLKNRWIHYAYNLTKKYLENEEETKYCLKIDIKKFYPSIDHNILKQLLRRKIKCKDTLKILDTIIDSYPGEKWVPIGSYLSQYLANYYLAYFDHYIKEELKCKYVVRYMDDVIILSNSKEFLHNILAKIQEYLWKIKLEVKHNYQIFPVDKRGIDFVGYRFFRKFILLRRSTTKRLKEKLVEIKKKKADKKRLLNYSEWCSVNSYLWRLIHCDSRRLCEKYIDPLRISTYRYYYYVITDKNKKKTRKFKRKMDKMKGRK